MIQQDYCRLKCYENINIIAHSKEDAISQLGKLISDLPYEHKLRISALVICSTDLLPADAHKDTLLASQLDPPTQDDNRFRTESYPPEPCNSEHDHTQDNSHHKYSLSQI